MLCPKCGSEKTKVVNTVKGIIQERTRKCLECGYVFQTVEAIKYDKYWREYVVLTQKVIEGEFK